MARRIKVAARLFVLPAALLGTMLHAAGVISLTSFTWERISVTIHPDSVQVDGLYSYRNPLPVPISQGLSIPVASGPGQGLPATIEARQMAPDVTGGWIPLRLLWFGERPYFSVHIPPRSTVIINIRFEQTASKGKASYLLTSTQAWRRPLESAEYVLRPEGVRIVSSNYSLSGDCLCFSKRKFMPDEDWAFTWVPQ